MAIAVKDASGHIAVVGSSARPDFNPRRVSVFNQDDAVISSRQFQTPILGLAVSRKKGHLAVCLADYIFWYVFTDRDSVPKRVATATNPEGIFALSDDGKLLAYPLGPRLIGVWHGNEELTRITTPHRISRLQFNPKGGGLDLLAASSRDGKSVWVWSLARRPTAAADEAFSLLYDFSRSYKETRVERLDFNAASSLLALSADSGTVHVFELNEANRVRPSFVSSFIPPWAPSLAPLSSRHKIRLPGSRRYSALVCMAVGEEFIEGSDAPRSVFVAGADGSLLEYHLPDGSDAAHLDTEQVVRREQLFK